MCDERGSSGRRRDRADGADGINEVKAELRWIEFDAMLRVELADFDDFAGKGFGTTVPNGGREEEEEKVDHREIGAGLGVRVVGLSRLVAVT